MRIHFLGTSSGVPTRERSLSGVAVRGGGQRGWLLVDCGEGTQHRLLHTRLSLATLEGVCITHCHGDHCLGLPGLLGTASMEGRQAPLTIIGPADIRELVTRSLALTDSNLGFPLRFIDVAAAAGALPDLAGLQLEAALLSHRIPSYAYALTQHDAYRQLDHDRLAAAGVPRGPLWGQLQRGEDVTLHDGRIVRAGDVLEPALSPRRIVVGGDNDTPALLEHLCQGAQLLVHEATYTEDVAARVGPAPMHSTAARVARFAREAGLPHLILTHFSPRYGNAHRSPHIGDIEAEARAEYDGALFLARDLDRYELDASGTLQPLA
ncbi:MAG: MBL fold metallo-hydrolase [Rhodocyclaceae bacterium]|nr:MBL fold metallo-hydrolase [Rhodocyclaceae bacterium]